MTKLLDRALKVVRSLPPAAQDDIARVVLRLAGANHEAPLPLTAEEQAAVAASKTAAERREFATDEQVRAVWAKTRPLTLRYTLPALADLRAILDYISAHSPQGARRVQARIQDLIDLLLLHPDIGHAARDPSSMPGSA